MKAYSMDLRERVVAARDEGVDTREEIAERFGVSVRWIRDLLRRRRETGSIAPRPRGGGRGPALAEGGPGPDPTPAELAEAAGVACCASAVHRALARLGISRERSRGGRPSRTGPN